MDRRQAGLLVSDAIAIPDYIASNGEVVKDMIGSACYLIVDMSRPRLKKATFPAAYKLRFEPSCSVLRDVVVEYFKAL